jgi:hypothetical protein
MVAPWREAGLLPQSSGECKRLVADGVAFRPGCRSRGPVTGGARHRRGGGSSVGRLEQGNGHCAVAAYRPGPSSGEP